MARRTSQRALQLSFTKVKNARTIFIPDVSSNDTQKIIKQLTILGILSLISHIWFIFIPLQSVNNGIEKNRVFLYAVVPCLAAIGMCPWVETFDYVIPDVNISSKAKITSIISGTTFLVLVNAIFSEHWGLNIFPVPFATLIMGCFSLPITLVVLFALTPETKERQVRENFGRCVKTSFWFTISVIIVLCWAGLVGVLRNSNLQFLCSMIYPLLKFLTKNFLLAPTLTKMIPRQYLIVWLIIDIIYARVQVAVYPYVDSISTFISLLLSSSVGLLWRYWGGSDRIGLLADVFMKKYNHSEKLQGESSDFKSIGAVLVAPLKDTHEASMRLYRFKLERKDGAKLDKIIPMNESLSDNEESSTNEEVPVLDLEVGVPPTSITPSSPSSDGNGLSRHEDACVDLDMFTRERLTYCDNTLEYHRTRRGSMRVVGTFATMSSMLRPSSKGDDLRKDIPELEWEQRMLFHVIDGVGGESVTLLIRFQHLLSMFLVRHLPNKRHLNATYYISDDQWRRSFVMGWILFILNVLILMAIGYIFKMNRSLKDRELTMTGVLTYIYGENSLFLGMWISATGMFVWSMMINHFGADFSLQFRWLTCMVSTTPLQPPISRFEHYGHTNHFSFVSCSFLTTSLCRALLI
jgi:hypothetical protein